ncbi:DUF4403 family protein [Erythrobacter insulae]|uniref:DUF4403 family protein n=1 Tax=Erythrobacter insulae TaxID=2584124 RepID=A0A547PDY2_9SPHN|nr:DUF4403 family protein [Erythrobacter insulae]TRD12345.1 DUF4403 family protein [Erythrobacter insulae]
MAAQSTIVARLFAIAIPVAMHLTLSGCSLFEQKVEPPPRVDTPIEVPEGHSKLSTRINIDLAPMRAALEREVPKQLWSINRPGAECVPSQRTEVIGITLKSPVIRCDLNGAVSRGSINLTGRGQDLIVTMPIRAKITASDIGGVIKQQTANASASVSARVRLIIRKDWSVRGKVAISYDWKQPPTVSVLGQDVTFADRADKRLSAVIAKLERTLENEIAKLDLRSRIEPMWQRGFTVLSLNTENPPVWMRLTPRSLAFDGYSASRNSIAVNMQLDAGTEVFVGDKPQKPDAAPLPDMIAGNARDQKLALTLPVIAQYSQLEPVIARALNRRAKRPFPVPAIGDRMVELRSVSAYGTSQNRVAVGVEFEAWAPGKRDDPAIGTIWLTALPVNAPDSRKVEFVDPEYSVETSRFTTNVLLEIAKTRDFSSTIEDALTQNFEDDFDQLLGKVDRAVASKQFGDFTITTDIEKVSTGQITAYGEGLFLPVSAAGETQIRYVPR